MANGNGSLTNAWGEFDDHTRVDLAIVELDRIYRRIDEHPRDSTLDHSAIRVEMTNAITSVKSDFNQRIDLLRAEVRERFDKSDERQTRTTSWVIGAVGTLLVGLALLVAQLASSG